MKNPLFVSLIAPSGKITIIPPSFNNLIEFFNNEMFLTGSLETYKQYWGEESFSVANMLENISKLYERMGEYDLAKENAITGESVVLSPASTTTEPFCSAI